MNISKPAARVAVLATLALASTSVSAIEGLQISVKCPDVILSWPSTSGENYIVQWRPTLDTNTPWVTLTNSLPADWATNWTTFIHSNQVQCASTQSLAMVMTANGPVPAQFFSSALVDAVLAGQDTYPVATPPMPPVRTNGVWVPWESVYGPHPPIMMPISGALRQRVLAAATQGTLLMPDRASAATLSADDLSPPTPADGPQPDGPQPDGPQPTPSMGFYQVVMDGVKIAGSSVSNLTSGTLSGTIPIRFEAGNAANDGTGTNVAGILSCASLLIDGEKCQGGAILSAGNNLWIFTMDTAYLDNGTHWLQVMVSWKNPDTTDNNNQYFARWSDSLSITVSNQISYPNWEPEIGEMGISAYFLQTTCADADWTIDIYDSGSNFVQRLSGHTPDGAIEAYWNMVDTNGVTRTNAAVDPWFDSIVTVADPATARTPRKNQRPQSWPDHGKWVIAFQDFFKFEYSQNNAMQGAINYFANTSAKYGGYSLYYPQPGQTNDIGQTYPMRYQKTNHMDTNITSTAIFLDEQRLRIYLGSTNSRNFFFDGHGDANNIAGIPSSLLNATIIHRYRFVFLDACNTANGDLDKAFGINGPKRLGSDYYHKTGIRPAAFVGYTASVNYATGGPITVNGVQYDDTIPYQVPGFISNFLFYWDTDLMGYGLLSTIDNAKLYLPPVNGQYRENYLAIHGYYDLHIDEVNHRWDTW
jgi:hypothetical protein